MWPALYIVGHMKEKVTNAFLYPSTLDKKHIPKKALTWLAWMTVPFDVSEGGTPG